MIESTFLLLSGVVIFCRFNSLLYQSSLVELRKVSYYKNTSALKISCGRLSIGLKARKVVLRVISTEHCPLITK
jgi:hypothetical protein